MTKTEASNLKLPSINSILIFVAGKKAKHQVLIMPNRLGLILILIGFLIVLLNIIIDLIIGAFLALIPLGILLLGTSIGLLLFRSNKMELAKTFVLLIFIFALYLAASADVYQTGSHLYFITIALSAFIVYGYKKRHRALMMSVLCISFYSVAFLFDFSILPEYNFNENQVLTFFVINIISFSVISAVILNAYMKMMYFQTMQIKEKNEALRRTNKELDYFLYTSSHDLRAPLATLLGLLQISEQSSSESEKIHYQKLMKQTIQKMDSFIEDIIHFFKNSRLPVQNQEIDLKELIQDLIEETKQEAKLRGVDLLEVIPEALIIKSDLLRLKNILRNLISNAIKYSDQKKASCFVEVSVFVTDYIVEISVKDNGIGIDQEYLKSIFQMFYRASENSKGAGLGLYIAAETCRNINAILEVESEKEVGSKFILTLPAIV